MKHIIHDWDRERTLTILKNYHQAMTENDLLKEMLMLTDNRPSSSKWLDLTLFLMTDGRQPAGTKC